MSSKRSRRIAIALLVITGIVVAGAIWLSDDNASSVDQDNPASAGRNNPVSAERIVVYAFEHDYDWVRLNKRDRSAFGHGDPYDLEGKIEQKYAAIKSDEYDEIIETLSEDDMGCSDYAYEGPSGINYNALICESGEDWIIVTPN